MQKTKSIPPRRWLKISEAAAILGVHPASIRRGIARGDIPAAKIRSVGWRVDAVALDKILESAVRANR